MTPREEEQKRKAEDAVAKREFADQKFASSKCLACNGRGWGLAGRYPTKVTCLVCKGSGLR